MDAAEFVPLLLTHQARLYGFIRTLVAERNQADEILQQTNAVLLRKAEEFEPDTHFVAWAFRIAYFEVMRERKKEQRERLMFDDELVASLAAAAEAADERFVERRRFLQECLEKLSPRQRDVVRRRYLSGSGLAQLAEEQGISLNALKQLLFRAREGLRACINAKSEAAS